MYVNGINNNNQHFAFNMWDFRISFLLLLFNFEVELIIQIIYRSNVVKKNFFFSSLSTFEANLFHFYLTLLLQYMNNGVRNEISYDFTKKK